MGTISARDCLRIVELTEQVVAAMLIAARQGIELRQRVAGPQSELRDEPASMYEDLRQRIPLIEEDRALDGELRALLDDIRGERWALYAD